MILIFSVARCGKQLKLTGDSLYTTWLLETHNLKMGSWVDPRIMAANVMDTKHTKESRYHFPASRASTLVTCVYRTVSPCADIGKHQARTHVQIISGKWPPASRRFEVVPGRVISHSLADLSWVASRDR